jgi:hypothetical protein
MSYSEFTQRNTKVHQGEHREGERKAKKPNEWTQPEFTRRYTYRYIQGQGDFSGE